MAKGCREAVSPGGGLVWGSGPSRQTNPGQRKGKEALGEAGTCGQLYQLLTAVGDGGRRSQGSEQEAERAAWQPPWRRPHEPPGTPAPSPGRPGRQGGAHTSLPWALPACGV